LTRIIFRLVAEAVERALVDIFKLIAAAANRNHCYKTLAMISNGRGENLVSAWRKGGVSGDASYANDIVVDALPHPIPIGAVPPTMSGNADFHRDNQIFRNRGKRLTPACRQHLQSPMPIPRRNDNRRQKKA